MLDMKENLVQLGNNGDQPWEGIPKQDGENDPDSDPDVEGDPNMDRWQSDPDFDEAEFISDHSPPLHDLNRHLYAVVVDISGIHHLAVQYCRCLGHKLDDKQMLNLGFFPASFKCLKMFFSFRALDNFRLDNLESKMSAYQYYAKL